jgi:hypothetical protein
MRVIQRASRYLGSLLLIGIGVIHLYEYSSDHYSVIPVIGPLFVLNFAVAVVLALLIAAPLERLPRVGPAVLRLVMVAGIGFAAATIAGLLISESSTLFGFHEQGYRTTITLSLVFEAGVIVLFGLLLALEARAWTARPASSPATSERDPRPRARQPGLPVQQRGA